MTIQELFIESNKALAKTVSQIHADQWSLDMPAGTSRRPMMLDAAVRYHTYDDAWVPDVLAGKTKEEVGEQYEGLLKAGDIQANYEKHFQRANEAVAKFDDLDRVTHLSYGDFPARDFLQHIISFRAFPAYDIAKLIGADTTMDPELVAALDAEFRPVIESYRKMGVFPPAVDVGPDAGPQAKLLAMVGRS